MDRRKNETKRRKRKTSIFGQHKRSVLIVCSILVMLTGVLSVNAVNLYGKKRLYNQQEAELRAQISEQQARAEEVEAYEAYVKTDEYIKDVAEEKLGLVDPNEIIFKPAD